MSRQIINTPYILYRTKKAKKKNSFCTVKEERYKGKRTRNKLQKNNYTKFQHKRKEKRNTKKKERRRSPTNAKRIYSCTNKTYSKLSKNELKRCNL